jgi:hypothetical protein
MVKAAAVQRRTLLTKAKTDTNRIVYNQPKDLFSKKMDHVISIVADVEQVADKILSKEEDERLRKFTAVLDIYREAFQRQYQLDDRFLDQVMYEERYYNKTAKEKEVKDDLERQFKDLHKQQVAYRAGVNFITDMCRRDRRLDTNRYLAMLLTEDTAVVAEQVSAEIERLRAIDTAPAAVEAEVVDGADHAWGAAAAPDEPDEPEQTMETVVLGVLGGLDFTTDFPEWNKRATIELEYPAELGKVITDVFERLRQYGVRTSMVTMPELVH